MFSQASTSNKHLITQRAATSNKNQNSSETGVLPSTETKNDIRKQKVEIFKKESQRFKKESENRSKGDKSYKLPSFDEMQVAVVKTGKRLQRKYTDLSVETTKNVVTYSRQLPKDMWSDEIDDTIFKAQLFQHFNFSNTSVLERIYQVAAHQDRDPKLTVEQYADLICLFLSSNNKAKADFAFNCYDFHGQDYITKQEVQYMVSPMLTLVVDDVDELSEHIRFVVNMLFEVIDLDQNGRIEREEFLQLVESDLLMRECLGPCLPDTNLLEIFRKKIVNRTSFDVAGTFRNERRRSLRGPDLSKLESDIFKKLYPKIPNLELP